MIAHYRKTVVALLGGVLAWAQVAYVPDGHIDRGEYYGLAVALATALGVYGVTNRISTTAGEATDDRWEPLPVVDATAGVPDPVATGASAPAPDVFPNDGGI